MRKSRLLAIAEKVERATYSKDESREPNAIRLQTVFRQRPMNTWANLENSLIPYYEKLKPGSRKYYKELVEEVWGKFSPDDRSRFNAPLEDVYLIGYYLQRKELNTKADNNNQEEE